MYQRGHSQPARANDLRQCRKEQSVSERPFPTSQSTGSSCVHSWTECIREAIPNQPELDSSRKETRARVYQRGHSQPARAAPAQSFDSPESVSERPFPTSQSPALGALAAVLECIREAIPNQPEHLTGSLLQRHRVYQRGHSQPARAPVSPSSTDGASVSERPFPTSQSMSLVDSQDIAECIREAIPNQPEQRRSRPIRRRRVYQRGHSQPARADVSE